jgi:hypothetical protein
MLPPNATRPKGIPVTKGNGVRNRRSVQSVG